MHSRKYYEMHIIDILKEDDEELFEEYMRCIDNDILLNMEDVEYIIKLDRIDILRHKLIVMDYQCKMLIFDRFNVSLFNNIDYMDMLEVGMDEDRFTRYVYNKTVHTNILYKCFELGFNKFIIEQLNRCRLNITIMDEDRLEFGIYLCKNHSRVTFSNVSLKSIRRLVEENLIDTLELGTIIYVDIYELNELLSGYESRISCIIGYINITSELLEYVCNNDSYAKYIRNDHIYCIDSRLISNSSSNVLNYLSYKNLLTMYDKCPSENLFNYISTRVDIPDKLDIHLTKKKYMYRMSLLSLIGKTLNNMINRLGITIHIYMCDVYEEHQYLELYELVRLYSYNIIISNSHAIIPNILFKLEISEYKEKVYSWSYPSSVSSKLLKYCCRLFPRGLERFHQIYVENGTKLLKYYYDTYMKNSDNMFSNNDIEKFNIYSDISMVTHE